MNIRCAVASIFGSSTCHVLESLFHQCPIGCMVDAKLPSIAWK